MYITESSPCARGIIKGLFLHLLIGGSQNEEGWCRRGRFSQVERTLLENTRWRMDNGLAEVVRWDQKPTQIRSRLEASSYNEIRRRGGRKLGEPWQIESAVDVDKLEPLPRAFSKFSKISVILKPAILYLGQARSFRVLRVVFLSLAYSMSFYLLLNSAMLGGLFRWFACTGSIDIQRTCVDLHFAARAHIHRDEFSAVCFDLLPLIVLRLIGCGRSFGESSGRMRSSNMAVQKDEGAEERQRERERERRTSGKMIMLETRERRMWEREEGRDWNWETKRVTASRRENCKASKMAGTWLRKYEDIDTQRTWKK